MSLLCFSILFLPPFSLFLFFHFSFSLFLSPSLLPTVPLNYLFIQCMWHVHVSQTHVAFSKYALEWVLSSHQLRLRDQVQVTGLCNKFLYLLSNVIFVLSFFLFMADTVVIALGFNTTSSSILYIFNSYSLITLIHIPWLHGIVL